VVTATVAFKPTATRARLLKVASPVRRLMATLTVLSDLFVKIFFSLVNTFLAVAPMVCPQRYDTAEQAGSQQKRNQSGLSKYAHLAPPD